MMDYASTVGMPLSLQITAIQVRMLNFTSLIILSNSLIVLAHFECYTF